MNRLLGDVELLVAGRLSVLPSIASASHEELLLASEGVRFVVTREAVSAVLQALIAADQTSLPQIEVSAGHWAWFVRSGHNPGITARQAITPLDIEYEADAEDAIVEVISRLTELGDVVDGKISHDELRQMLETLTGYYGTEVDGKSIL